MKDIPIEAMNRVDECLAQDALDELCSEKGFEIGAHEALNLAKTGDKAAVDWLRAMLSTDAHYRREFFVKFPEALIRELVARADTTERNRRASLLAN